MITTTSDSSHQKITNPSSSSKGPQSALNQEMRNGETRRPHWKEYWTKCYTSTTIFWARMRWLASNCDMHLNTAMLPSLHRRPELPEHEDVRGVSLLEPEGFLCTLQDVKLLIGPLEFRHKCCCYYRRLRSLAARTYSPECLKIHFIQCQWT